MAATVPQPELLRALGRLTRGLSALFWGLPIALVVSVQTARADYLSPFGIFPPVITNSLLVYALVQLSHFQRQERVWRRALDRAELIAIVNVGLAPFLYWWKVLPDVALYRAAVLLLGLSGLVFLFDLNQVLRRLAAMLPDETLRLEAGLFTMLNFYLMLFSMLLVSLWILASRWHPSSPLLEPLLIMLDRAGLITVLLLVLLPLALTMSLIWKIKETIMQSVFASGANGRE